MKNKSIIQIINWIESFAITSAFVRGFGSGDSLYFDADVMKYPFLWASPQSSVITTSNKTLAQDLTFAILIMDRVNFADDQDNEISIISDSNQVAQDLLFEMTRSGEYSITSASTKVAYQGGSTANNREVGIILTLGIKVPYIACNTPKI